MGQGFPGCMSKWLRSATGMNNDDINAKKKFRIHRLRLHKANGLRPDNRQRTYWRLSDL